LKLEFHWGFIVIFHSWFNWFFNNENSFDNLIEVS
jgi:hypothetical protein